jgi:hypothetical protein
MVLADRRGAMKIGWGDRSVTSFHSGASSPTLSWTLWPHDRHPGVLNPAGAVIQAIIATYNTVTFFIEKARQIGAVVASFIDSIAAIAAGQVEGAAARVEQTLANTLTVVIAFLAKFAGLGGIPDKIVGIVKKIQQPIDKALDKIVAWLGKMLDDLVAKAKDTARKLLEWWRKKVPITGGDEPHTLTFQGERRSAKLVVMSQQPTEPEIFMTQTAKEKQIPDEKSAKPISDTRGYAERIRSLRTLLQVFDEKAKAAPSGEQAKEADALSKDLDDKLKKLAGHFRTTFIAWKVSDEVVKELKLSRRKLNVKWTLKQKLAVAAQHAWLQGDPKLLVPDKTGEKINVRPGIDRRHVVSLSDIGRHYMAVLNNQKASKAKLLLEERSSTSEARVKVSEPVNADAIKAAAIERYKNFFGLCHEHLPGTVLEQPSQVQGKARH